MISLSTYNRPVLLVGNGIRTANAAELLYKFADKSNIPVLTTMNAVDLAQDNLHIGFIGTHGNRIANQILNECDLVISIGARLGIRQVGRYSKCFAPKAHLIRCDIDEYELSRTIKKNESKYHMDAADFLKILLSAEIGDYSLWNGKCFEAKAYLESYDKQPGNYAVETISAILPENPIVSVDVGMNQCWCAQSLHLKGRRGRIHISGGYGTMGCGLPYAIGSSIATQNGKSYCICGDGGFQMNIQELETVSREKLPIKIFILNNRVLGKISETQHFDNNDRFVSTTSSSGYSVPEFVKISQAYGIRAVKLQSYLDLYDYQEWVLDDLPCLFDIALPEDSLLTPKINFRTGVIRPELDESIVHTVIDILNS